MRCETGENSYVADFHLRVDMLLLRYPIWVNLSIKRIGLVHKPLLMAGPELRTLTFSAGLIQSHSNYQ